MTTGIRDRDSLYVRLREVLGDEQAATLMELLPPDRERLATKADVLDAKTALTADIAELRTELKADMAELRTELKTDIAELRTELKTDIAELRTELKADVAALQSDVAEMKADIAALQSDVAEIKALMAKFDERLWEFHGALRSQTRTFVTATISSMIGVGGLAFAAAAFV